MKNLIPIFSLLFLIICWSGCKNGNSDSDSIKTRQFEDLSEEEITQILERQIETDHRDSLGFNKSSPTQSHVAQCYNTAAARFANNNYLEALPLYATALHSTSKHIVTNSKSRIDVCLNSLISNDPSFNLNIIYEFYDDAIGVQTSKGHEREINGDSYYFQPFEIVGRDTVCILFENNIEGADITSTEEDYLHYIGLKTSSDSIDRILGILKDDYNHYYSQTQGSGHEHDYTTYNSSYYPIINNLDFEEILKVTALHRRTSMHFHSPCRISSAIPIGTTATVKSRKIEITQANHPLTNKEVKLVVTPSDCIRMDATLNNGDPVRVKIVGFTMINYDGTKWSALPMEYVAYYPYPI